MRAAVGADQRHAHPIFANAAQRQAEGRMNQPPRKQKHQKQHRKRIGVGGRAVNIEFEQAEQRPDLDALQSVRAAGQPARAVAGLLQQQAEAERNHDQREVAETRDDEARGVADQGRHRGADHQPAQRFAPDEFREQPGGIGADAEKRRVAERNDAGVTEDEIERQRKQRADRDLARQRQIIRKQHERQQRYQPEGDFERVPAA